MKTLKMLGLCGAVALSGASAVAHAFEDQVVLRHGSECTIKGIEGDEVQQTHRGPQTTKTSVTSLCPFTTTYHIGGTPNPADRDYHPQNLVNANIFGDGPIMVSYFCITDQLTPNYVCKKGSRLSSGHWMHSHPQQGEFIRSGISDTWPYGARDTAVLYTVWKDKGTYIKGYEGHYLLDFTDWNFR